MHHGQITIEEVLAVRVVHLAYGWGVLGELLDVHSIELVLLVDEGVSRAGQVSRVDALRVRGRLRFLQTTATTPLEESARHLLAPLFDALGRDGARRQGRPVPKWSGGEDEDLDARRDLVAVLGQVLARWGDDPAASAALGELEERPAP